MSDELLPYYQKELSYLRRLGREFAEIHPNDAASLRISAETCDDPHVERMIESFAYLTARIRQKLDDDFPELTDGLLSILYPHYLAPIPSMAIVEFTLDKGQGGLAPGLHIPVETGIETQPVDGEPCRFRTAYPVRLFPIEVVSARLGPVPFGAAGAAQAAGATAVLRIELRCIANDMTFSKLQMSNLRFFLKGQPQHTLGVYELLFNNAVHITLANAVPGSDPAARQQVSLDIQSLQQVGFDLDQALLPYSARSSPGYRLLTEYFAFQEKFLFFDLDGLASSSALSNIGNKLELNIYLDRSSPQIENYVSADMFRLGCTPIVNLYKQVAETIDVSQMQSEYRVVPDARRPRATEVYSIERVSSTTLGKSGGMTGGTVEFVPFYSYKHASAGAAGNGGARAEQMFWYASRRPAEPKDGKLDNGTEVYLSLVNQHGSNVASAGAEGKIVVETLCLNRDLPHRLPFGGGQPRLSPSKGGPFSITCLTAPTATLRPPHRSGAMWRLVSHLSLNHLSIGGTDGSADALKEILKLYNFTNSPATQARINGILQVRNTPAVARAGGVAAGGFCRGVQVRIVFDEDRFTDNGLFLFASVIERFLALYCSINSFTKLVAGTKQRQEDYRQWAPRAAEKILL